jgi:hypothetical protein
MAKPRPTSSVDLVSQIASSVPNPTTISVSHASKPIPIKPNEVSKTIPGTQAIVDALGAAADYSEKALNSTAKGIVHLPTALTNAVGSIADFLNQVTSSSTTGDNSGGHRGLPSVQPSVQPIKPSIPVSPSHVTPKAPTSTTSTPTPATTVIPAAPAAPSSIVDQLSNHQTSLGFNPLTSQLFYQTVLLPLLQNAGTQSAQVAKDANLMKSAAFHDPNIPKSVQASYDIMAPLISTLNQQAMINQIPSALSAQDYANLTNQIAAQQTAAQQAKAYEEKAAASTAYSSGLTPIIGKDGTVQYLDGSGQVVDPLNAGATLAANQVKAPNAITLPG